MSGTFPTLLELMRNYICDTQTALLQYIFLANNKHKAVKEFLEELESGAIKGSYEQACKDLAYLLTDLDEHLLIKFGEVFDSTYEYSLKYFEGRSLLPPRMTLKVVLALDKLVTLFKIPETYVYETDVGLAENTAFDRIADGERQYFCNDIPKSIRNGSYFNTRIDLDKAKEFAMKDVDLHIEDDDTYDKAWSEAWKRIRLVGSDKTIKPPPETCYKSTVVLPVSLETEKLASEFINKFRISNESERALFGFLCLDHPTTDFFNEGTDTDFISILADILSCYLISQMTYTQFSSIYYKAKLVASGMVSVL
jgi:hypothetical protein